MKILQFKEDWETQLRNFGGQDRELGSGIAHKIFLGG